MEADALILPGFTFGLDILLLVGQLRLREHQMVDEIHRTLTQRLALIGQTICRREMLFLFEAYTALLRAGTEVSQDAAWKEEVRENKGLLLSIDGIQPDNGNETIYLVHDVLTGRILTAENVTDSTKERLKQVLASVVALDLPVIGVISDAQPTTYPRWLERCLARSYKLVKQYMVGIGMWVPLCWLLGTSVRKIRRFLRTDVPSSQHNPIVKQTPEGQQANLVALSYLFLAETVLYSQHRRSHCCVAV
jgi:hypothetical protein